MKICFLARPCYDVFSSKIFNYLHSKYNDCVACFITSNKKESNYIYEHVGKNAEVYEVSTFFKKHWNEFTFEKLIEFEKKFDCSPIWKYIYTDRFLINRSYDYCIKITVGYFCYFDNIFNGRDIEFYYDEAIATLQSYIAYIVGKYYGVRYISQMTARGGIDSTYNYFLDDPYQIDMNLDINYMDKVYSEDCHRKAEEYLTEFENKDVKPSNMVFVETQPRFKLNFLLLPIHYLYSYNKPENKDKYFYMYYHAASEVLNPYRFYRNYKRCRKYYHRADLTKKYVYFPLHYQPEASTIVCAQKYEKQLFFIDSWAKSLPADTLLYVKEHYALIGHRDPHFYEELKQYPNVVLIDPWENSRTLINHCVAMTTLTGTAGWEAMLLRKPVFLGGRIFYENAPGVIKIDDIYQNYLPNMQSWVEPKREETLQYLAAFFNSLSLGNVYAASSPALKDDNIKLVSEALYYQLKKMEMD